MDLANTSLQALKDLVVNLVIECTDESLLDLISRMLMMPGPFS